MFESNKTLIPPPTHSSTDTLVTSHWITLREAIGNLPKLRAEKGKNIDKKLIFEFKSGMTLELKR